MIDALALSMSYSDWSSMATLVPSSTPVFLCSASEDSLLLWNLDHCYKENAGGMHTFVYMQTPELGCLSAYVYLDLHVGT